ncbi:MAG: radical SAM protein [Spirochaetaceae bacterium]
MSITNSAEKLVLRKLRHSINGDPKRLRKLIDSTRKMDLDVDVRNFVDSLESSLDNGTPFSRIFLRVGNEMSRAYKQGLVTNLIYNSFIRGSQRREELSANGNTVPSVLVISPTMRCNLNCTGCYSGLYEKQGELSREDLENILDQARDLGIYFIVVSGGEPYMMKDTLTDLFAKYNDMFFLTYTNGTFFDRDLARRLGKLGNVAPAISVEGWQKETDERRGRGIWDRVHTAMENLRREGVMFGISVTQTKYNLDAILDDAFVEHFINQGTIFGWYFMFMPVGKDPILDLVPTPEQRVYSANRVRELRAKYPMFLADFWNDGDAVNGCMAGGKGYAHVISNGNVEPCVFAHFGIDNIREKSLFEALNSPFFKHIRSRFPYNENANLRRPCMIIDNPEVLRDVVNTHLVPHGHEHSEDLINDPETVKWIDRYADEYRKLIDPIWERIIDDPNSKWYRHGKQYKRLFRFQKDPSGKTDVEEETGKESATADKEPVATG